MTITTTAAAGADATAPTEPPAPPAPIRFVDLAAQHAEVATVVDAAIAEVIATSAFVNGPAVSAFEAAWAAYCGRTHAIGVASGTDALELSLRAAGVGPGDEIILPTNSFIASAGAVARTGAQPRLVDCDPAHLLVDPDAVQAAIGPRTAGILPVHLYGQLAPMEVLADIAGRAGLTVVEDAAQAHGASRHGRSAGSWGVASGFSFYPGKNLGAYGDAGAVVTDSDAVAAKVGALRNHGGRGRYEHPELGFNARLDTIQAAVLLAKLARLDEWNARRQAAAARYDEMLTAVPAVRRPVTLPGNDPVWHLYVVRVPERAHCLERLEAAGIPAAIHYPVPIHLTGAYSHLGHRAGEFPVAEAAASEILSLPMHPHLTEGQQEMVVAALDGALR